MKYRKKPIVVEAFQVIERFYDYCDEWPDWMKAARAEGIIFFEYINLTLVTLEGTLYASVDDYIIQGTKGELYPCKPDIFETIYEEVSDEEVANLVN
jgi:hypothetical protein